MRLGLTQIPLHSLALTAPEPPSFFCWRSSHPPFPPPLDYPFLPGPLFFTPFPLAEGAIAAAAVFGLWSQRGGFFRDGFLLRSGKRRVGLGPSLAAEEEEGNRSGIFFLSTGACGVGGEDGFFLFSPFEACGGRSGWAIAD